MKQCAVQGCENTDDAGVFIGEYCYPCDIAIKTGIRPGQTGKAWIFQMHEAIEECYSLLSDILEGRLSPNPDSVTKREVMQRVLTCYAKSGAMSGNAKNVLKFVLRQMEGT